MIPKRYVRGLGYPAQSIPDSVTFPSVPKAAASGSIPEYPVIVNGFCAEKDRRNEIFFVHFFGNVILSATACNVNKNHLPHRKKKHVSSSD